jgi:hypothetical protein
MHKAKTGATLKVVLFVFIMFKMVANKKIVKNSMEMDIYRE